MKYLHGPRALSENSYSAKFYYCGNERINVLQDIRDGLLNKDGPTLKQLENRDLKHAFYGFADRAIAVIKVYGKNLKRTTPAMVARGRNLLIALSESLIIPDCVKVTGAIDERRFYAEDQVIVQFEPTFVNIEPYVVVVDGFRRRMVDDTEKVYTAIFWATNLIFYKDRFYELVKTYRNILGVD